MALIHLGGPELQIEAVGSMTFRRSANWEIYSVWYMMWYHRPKPPIFIWEYESWPGSQISTRNGPKVAPRTARSRPSLDRYPPLVDGPNPDASVQKKHEVNVMAETYQELQKFSENELIQLHNRQTKGTEFLDDYYLRVLN